MTLHDELMALAGDIEAEIKAARDVEAEIQRNLITLIGSPPNSMYPDLMERLTSSQRRRVVVGLWAMRIRALLDSDAFRAMVRDLERLRGFAAAVMEDWSAGDLDGGTRQDLAERFGLLRSVERFEPCGEACGCSEYFGDGDWEHGQSCYRLTSLVTGDPSTDAAIDAAASGAGE